MQPPFRLADDVRARGCRRPPEQAPLICVVDADAAVRDALAITLEAAGYRVRVFASPQQFLAQQEPGRAGCLLVDLELIETEGQEFLRRLGTDRLPLPTLVMTARLRRWPRARNLPAGVAGVLEKPFGDHELLLQIKDAMRACANPSQ